MNIDEAREALRSTGKTYDATQDGTDLVLSAENTEISYEDLRELSKTFSTDEINFENTTCENGYYGEHREGRTELRIKGILSPPPPPVSLRSFNFGNLSCSFCGKQQREVKKLISGLTVYICDECVKLCQSIIDEDK